MAATSVPQLVAYAQGVGYASYRGLATAGPPLFAWGMATGSPFMSCGVTSITALMAKADLDGESYVAEHGEVAYVELVAAYSLWVGLCSAILGIVGFGKLAGMVPSNVRKGFKVRRLLCYDVKELHCITCQYFMYFQMGHLLDSLMCVRAGDQF